MATLALTKYGFQVQGGIQLPTAVFRRIGILLVVVALALVLGQAASTSVFQDHHAERSVELSPGTEDAAAPCDPGLLCASSLLPVNLASGVALVFALSKVSSREGPPLCLGGAPAVDLPPPRYIA